MRLNLPVSIGQSNAPRFLFSGSTVALDAERAVARYHRKLKSRGVAPAFQSDTLLLIDLCLYGLNIEYNGPDTICAAGNGLVLMIP